MRLCVFWKCALFFNSLFAGTGDSCFLLPTTQAARGCAATLGLLTHTHTHPHIHTGKDKKDVTLSVWYFFSSCVAADLPCSADSCLCTRTLSLAAHGHNMFAMPHMKKKNASSHSLFSLSLVTLSLSTPRSRPPTPLLQMRAAAPLWINDIPVLDELQHRGSSPTHASSSSLIRIRDVFRCNTADPQECWRYVLLSSYMTDLHWLLAAVPELAAVTTKLVILSGDKGTATVRRVDGSRYVATSAALNRVNPFLAALRSSQSGLTPDRFVALEPPLPVAFGTHHTKMAVCVNERGVRVCVFSANLLEQDWCCKTQGVYAQDFPWAPSARSPECGDKAREFEQQLRHYWTHCGVDMTVPFSWEAAQGLPLGIFNTDFLSAVDFAAAKVWLVSSVPGTHVGGEASPGYRVGLCRLAEVLRRVAPVPTRAAPVVLTWQYSSQGSLNSAFLASLQSAMCGDTCFVSRAETKVSASPETVAEVQVIYPTEWEVRNSVEGWRGGGSLPVRLQSCHEFVNERLHRWGGQHRQSDREEPGMQRRHNTREGAVNVDESDSDHEAPATEAPHPACLLPHRQHAMPHIKSYAAMDAARTHLHWYLLTSANLSQAAWGSLSGKPTKAAPRRLLVRSYELGVVFDATSAVDSADPSSWFSVVRSPSLRLPIAANSAAALYSTPLGGASGGTPALRLFLPCDMLHPEPYASTAALRAHRLSTSTDGPSLLPPSALSGRDVPWVVDVPHGGCDAYGRGVEEAFSAETLPPLFRWRPRTREPTDVAAAPSPPLRKRTRDD